VGCQKRSLESVAGRTPMQPWMQWKDVAEGKTEEVAKRMTKEVTRTLEEVANDGRGGDRRDGCSAG
jgi:hypothetical protein